MAHLFSRHARGSRGVKGVAAPRDRHILPKGIGVRPGSATVDIRHADNPGYTAIILRGQVYRTYRIT